MTFSWGHRVLDLVGSSRVGGGGGYGTDSLGGWILLFLGLGPELDFSLR